MVAEHEIVRAAEQRATSVLSEAETAALRIRAEADAYVREVMESLEQELGRAASTARAGMQQLEEHLQRSTATVRAGIESLPAGGAVAPETGGRRRRR